MIMFQTERTAILDEVFRSLCQWLLQNIETKLKNWQTGRDTDHEVLAALLQAEYQDWFDLQAQGNLLQPGRQDTGM